MDASSNLYSASSLAAKIWDSPYFYCSVITLVALAAIACYAVGGVACSGVALNAIGYYGGIPLIVTGGVATAADLLFLFLKMRRPVLSYQDAQTYKFKLKLGEFFVFQGDRNNGFQKRIFLSNPESDVGLSDFHYVNYTNFKKTYSEVSLKELQSR